MNILHMRYALEVARAGSVNRAAEALLVAQPNLSRAIRELESELGVALFARSSRGMRLTPEGEAFMRRAQEVVSQLDHLEAMYRPGLKRRFSLCAPRDAVIADAFARFAAACAQDAAELVYAEAASQRALEGVLGSAYRLGIVRYAADCDAYYRAAFAERGLACEPLADFEPVTVMSRDCPLAELPRVESADLRALTEAAYAEPDSLSPRAAEEDLSESVAGRRCAGRILVDGRAAAMSLLSRNPDVFMRCAPLPEEELERYALTQRPCAMALPTLRDALIYRRDDALTAPDRRFLDCLREARAGAQG